MPVNDIVRAATWLAEASRRLAPVSDSARLDAEVLYCHATGLGRAGLLAHPEHRATPEQAQRLHELLSRRLAGEPVAYLTGRREFWSLSLRVAPPVLIPRPETELLVARALDRVPPAASWNIADIGTGSGAVALAVARERPACRIVASDISGAALKLARENARELGTSNVEFRHGDCCEPLTDGPFDLVLSNPPYVADHDPHLERGDLRFEPRSALAAGADGLDVIRRLVRDAVARLRPGGWLLLEHGADQGALVRQLMQEAGLEGVTVYRDDAGHDRVCAGARPMTN
jgi:release factor glutamine methyltransferase